MVIHHHRDVLCVLPLHVSSGSFDLFASILPFLLSLLDVSHQVFTALEEPLPLCFKSFSSISSLISDGVLQLPDISLQDITLLLLD